MKRILAGVASLALILSVLLPAAGFNLPTRIERVTADSCNLFSDNFERDSIGANWTVVDDEPGSRWMIQGGTLYQGSNVFRSENEFNYMQGTNIITGEPSWTDYTFSFDVTPTDNDGVGAIFRYQDQNNYYRFIMSQDPASNGPVRRIDKIVNGQPFVVLAEDKSNSFETFKTYHVTISVIGSAIKVYLDGQEILSANDHTFKAGKVGLMTYACYANFDNVCVSGQSNPSVKPPSDLRAYPGNNKVYLEWSPPANSGNIAGYYVYRSTQNGVYTSPLFNSPVRETNYLDQNVENGKTYYYICKTVYADNTLSGESSEVAVSPKAPTAIVNIPDNRKVTSSQFSFTGKVDQGATVWVNGKQVAVDSAGNFTAAVTLNNGTNTLTIEVKNKAGDIIKITKVVTYEETSQPPTPTTSEQLIITLQINNPFMTVNGVRKEIDPGRGTVPVIVNSRTLVPIRAIIEEMGGSIEWDSTARKVTIKLNDKTIILTIDKKQALVNGYVKELDVAPQIINSRTMLPLRFITEELGCNVEWDGDTKTVAVRYTPSTPTEPSTPPIGTGDISSSGEKVFTSAGGELTLSDGTKLIVPANAFSADSRVVLTSGSFGKDTRSVDISGLQNLRGEITLSYPLGKGLSKETVSAYGLDMDSETAFNLTNSYDEATGIVTVKINPTVLTVGTNRTYLSNLTSLQGLSGMFSKVKVVFQWTKKYTPSRAEYIINMPYYGQAGNNCWAASTNMLIRGYVGPSVVGEPLSRAMRYLGVDDEDFGIGLFGFTQNLPAYVSSETGGKQVEWKSFSDNNHIKWEILRQLDAGHPLLLRYYGEKGFHCVLVIGYKDNGETFVIHDPKDVTPDDVGGTMYTVEPWSWVERRLNQLYLKSQVNQILWIDEPMGSPNTLQTLEATGGDESYGNAYGEIKFIVVNPRENREVPVAQLQFKPSSPEGYVWTSRGEAIDVIPSKSEKLRLDFPIWNASFESKNLTVIKRIVAHSGSSSKEVYYDAKDITVKPASYNTSNTTKYKIDIALEDIRDPAQANMKGEQEINIEVYIRDFQDSSSMKDRFDINATLSVIPVVASVSYAEVNIGDTLTINGYAFGKVKTPKSKVTIGDKNADILSWSEKQIKVKIPNDVEVGPNPVVVYTGVQYEYASKSDVTVKVFKPRSCDAQYSFTLSKVPRWVNGAWDDSGSIGSYISLSAPVIVTDKENPPNGVGTVLTCSAPTPTKRYSENISGTYTYNAKNGTPIDITFTFSFASEWTAGSCNYGEFYSGTFSGTYSPGTPFSPARFNGSADGTVRNYRKCGDSSDYDQTKTFTSAGTVGKSIKVQTSP